ncbi:MAG: hypothetical protein WCQ99_02365 [Pseudomonadota bacterium]
MIYLVFGVIIAFFLFKRLTKEPRKKQTTQLNDEEWAVNRLMAQLKKEGKSDLEIIEELKKRGYKIDLHMSSFSDEDTSYAIDTENITCSCPDFSKRRQHYKQDDPRRLCKHLARTLFAMGLPDQFKKFKNIIKHFSEKKTGFDLADNIKTININSKHFIILWSRDNPWVNIYEEADRFGYNVEEARWSYGKAPVEGEEILKNLGMMIYAATGRKLTELYYAINP